MEEILIERIVKKQNRFFYQGKTKNPEYRIQALLCLKQKIIHMSDEICKAIDMDLGRSGTEAYMTEVGMALSEISYMIKHIRKFSKPRRVSTPLSVFPAKGCVVAEPYGTVLVMSPWNYPFLLSIGPAIDAVAAGNTVIIKPSAYSAHTSKVLSRLIRESFPSCYVTVIEGGREVNTGLLNQKFDYIFFTGGKSVGKLVMKKASEYLTPVTLELGGKSPCIVDETADLKIAAKRIIFGKLLNAGQTCVAPDYLFVQESVKKELVYRLKQTIVKFYGENPLSNNKYSKIINAKHFERLKGLIAGETVLYGGENDGAEKIAPTLLDNITKGSPIMQEEIFGPILPIIPYKKLEEVIDYVRNNPKPLALYLFTENAGTKRHIIKELSFGGGCINDTIMHLAVNQIGFGGVGESGMGSYHGKYGFDTFTHYKGIVDKSTWADPPIRYQPGIEKYSWLIKKFMG